ncbi:MAG: hypothetical protein ACRCX8_12475 [Sarcina sp.]
MTKKIHVLLHDDTNIDNFTTNTLYVGEVTANNTEYLAIKDEFGDTIKLRDEQTTDIENFAKNFIQVSNTVNWNSTPKIVFQISKYTNKKDVLNELHQKMTALSTEIKPMKEVLQLDNNRYEFIPFISAHGSFVTVKLVQSKDDVSVSDGMRTLLTEIWRSHDVILMKLWECYKNLVNLIASLALSTAKQFKDIIKIDMSIIETKIRIDGMLRDIQNVSWVEDKWVHHIIDLRQHPSNKLFQLIINGSTAPDACVGKWFIIQDTKIDNNINRIGTAMIEVLNNVVLDFKASHNNINGIKLIPNDIEGSFPFIALHGGARYHIFRTPQGTNPLGTNLTEVTTLVNKYKHPLDIKGCSSLYAKELVSSNQTIVIKSCNGEERFKINIG